jgi:hypothetical protein
VIWARLKIGKTCHIFVLFNVVYLVRSLKMATSNQLLVTGYLKKKSWLLVASYLNQETLATSSQLL